MKNLPGHFSLNMSAHRLCAMHANDKCLQLFLNDIMADIKLHKIGKMNNTQQWWMQVLSA